MSLVLYIDDEPDILELAEIYFAEQGIKVHTAANAQNGLKLIEQNVYSVVISDARMPGLKGLELYELLRSSPHFKGHFILVSGHYGGEEDQGFPSGIAHVLTKPIDFDDLILKVRALLTQ